MKTLNKKAIDSSPNEQRGQIGRSSSQNNHITDENKTTSGRRELIKKEGGASRTRKDGPSSDRSENRNIDRRKSVWGRWRERELVIMRKDLRKIACCMHKENVSPSVRIRPATRKVGMSVPRQHESSSD